MQRIPVFVTCFKLNWNPHAVLPAYVQTGQQRNVSLYITHLLLDTAALLFVFQPMIELWLGLSETTGAVRTGCWALSYLVSCYALELTWRRRIDTMLAVHHVGTIAIILLYAGEYSVSMAAAAALRFDGARQTQQQRS
jgi:hypothetical protein